MEIISLCGRGFASNTYILKSDAEAAVIDPSCELSLLNELTKECRITRILLTHGHFDHFLTLEELRKQTQAQIYIHENDAKFLTDADLNGSRLLLEEPIAASAADLLLKDGDIIDLGDEKIAVLSTPGHTAGSVCYDCGNILITGDTLFDIGYGRYDLPSGDPHKLVSSLRMLAERNDDPEIYPGHGPGCRLSKAEYIIYLRKF